MAYETVKERFGLGDKVSNRTLTVIAFMSNHPNQQYFAADVAKQLGYNRGDINNSLDALARAGKTGIRRHPDGGFIWRTSEPKYTPPDISDISTNLGEPTDNVPRVEEEVTKIVIEGEKVEAAKIRGINRKVFDYLKANPTDPHSIDTIAVNLGLQQKQVSGAAAQLERTIPQIERVGRGIYRYNPEKAAEKTLGGMKVLAEKDGGLLLMNGDGALWKASRIDW